MANEQSENNSQQEANDLGCDADVPVVHVPPPEHRHHATKVTQHSKHSTYRWVEKIREVWPSANHWTMVAALVSAISTTVYACYAYKQWQTMSNQYTQMVQANNQTDRAIAESKRSANAAEEANADAVEHFREDERPYMGLDFSLQPPPGERPTPANAGSVIEWKSDTDDPTKGIVGWSFHYKNYGKTPALNVRIDRHLEVGPDAFTKIHWSAIGEAGVMVAPSQDGFVAAVSKTLPERDYQSARAANRQIVVFGHIDYEGLDGVPYWTEFCFFKIANGPLSFCPSHNLMR